MIVQNQWYVAAWDNEVDQTPISRKICNETIVLYRKFNRDVVALRDACPHRLLPLSMGIKEGDNLRCRYHGLLFNEEGVCIEEPAQPDQKKPLCVQKYQVIERHRFVWVWIGDQKKADPALVPDLWPCSHEDWVFDGGYYHLECDYRLGIDNLMDLTHETYTHQGSIGQPEILNSPIETTVDGDRVYVTRWMPDIDAPPFWRNALKKEGNVDRWQICEFIPPSSVIIDVGVAPVGAGATIEDHDQGVRGFVIDALTPETDTTCHYFWGMARNFDITDAGFTARFKAQQGGVFLEDVEVLSAQQKSIDANPDMPLKALNIDSGGVRSRMVISRLYKAQQKAEGKA